MKLLLLALLLCQAPAFAAPQKPVSVSLNALAKAMPAHAARLEALASAASAAQTPAARFEVARELAELRAALGPLTGEPAGLYAEAYAASVAGLDASMQGRLDAIAAGLQSRQGADAAVPAVAGGAADAARLAPARKKPLSDDELAALIKTSVRGLKSAEFQGEQYRPEYEARLKALGADVVAVDNPTPAQLRALTEQDGYHLSSAMLRWVTPVPGSLEKYVEAADPKNPDGRWPNTKVRGSIRTELKKSKDVQVSLEPLRKEAYEEWYEIWDKEVGGKPGGTRAWHKDFPSKLVDPKQSPTDPSKWFLLTFRVNGELVGGAAMMLWTERELVSIGAAAYKAEFKGKYSLSVRTFAEAMRLAASKGFDLLSYGSDFNLYGYDFALGLNNYKVSVGMVPYPEKSVRLVKLLSGDKFKAPDLLNKDGKSEGFFLYRIPRESELAARYLKSAEAGAPAQAETLIGGKYFTPAALPAAATLRGVHYVDSDLPARLADGLESEKKPLP